MIESSASNIDTLVNRSSDGIVLSHTSSSLSSQSSPIPNSSSSSSTSTSVDTALIKLTNENEDDLSYDSKAKKSFTTTTNTLTTLEIAKNASTTATTNTTTYVDKQMIMQKLLNPSTVSQQSAKIVNNYMKSTSVVDDYTSVRVAIRLVTNNN